MVVLTSEAQALLTDQQGLATFAQLAGTGVGRGPRRWNTQRGWRIVLPGVVATFTGPPSPRQRAIAALLYAGGDSALTSWTAAAWHGVTAAAGTDRRVHVEVPESRRARTCGFVVVHRTARPDAFRWQRPPLAFVSRARAVVEAARAEPHADSCTAIVVEAVQRRLVTIAALRHEVEAGQRRGSRLVRAAVAVAESGAWSVPEHDLATVVAGSRVLPEMWANPEVRSADGTRLPTPDGWFADAALAVQVHSRRHHEIGQSWEVTVMQDGVFAEYDIPLVAVTPAALALRPQEVLLRIERAYRAAKARPVPGVSARRYAVA